MPAAKTLEGQVFGRLTVVERFRSRNGRVTWLCRCECGKLHEAVSNALTSGHTNSCGCWRKERNRSSSLKHGHSKRGGGLSATYQSWRGMCTRCTNPNAKSYKDYGGKGVGICVEWLDFENFLADMGERPTGMTLDRRDASGNYEPGNCRWATKIEQQRNTTANSRVTFEGVTMTQAEWAIEKGIKQTTLSYRLRSGWSLMEALSLTPRLGLKRSPPARRASGRFASKYGDVVDLP